MRSAYRSEPEALRGFASRQAFILRGIHTSPLEPPCGGPCPFVRAADELRASAIAWPSLEPDEIADGLAHFLDRCEAVADRALGAFEPLRTVYPPYPLWQTWEFEYLPRPLGRMDQAMFPRAVHDAARILFFELHTTSRSNWHDAVHSLDGLDRAGYFGRGPLGNVQLSAVAALVCLARTFYALDDVLRHWSEAACEFDPRLHFRGQHGSQWWELVLGKAREGPHVKALERDNLGRAERCLSEAEAWIRHICLMEETAEIARKAAAQAAGEIRQAVSRTARENASRPRRGWPQFISDADVASVLDALGDGAKHAAIIHALGDRARANVSEREVPEPRGDPDTAAARAYKRFRAARRVG